MWSDLHHGFGGEGYEVADDVDDGPLSFASSAFQWQRNVSPWNAVGTLKFWKLIRLPYVRLFGG